MKTNLIYGVNPIVEAIEAGKTVDKIMISKDNHNEDISKLKLLVANTNVQVQYIPQEKIKSICYKNRLHNVSHQGVIAFISMIDYYDIEQLIPSLYEKAITPLILVLDEVSDVRNFGALCRTAECAGVHAVVIPSKGAAQINAVAMKTSAGALNHLPVCKVASLKQSIRYLKESGLSVFAATEKAADSIYQYQYNMPMALVVGSEEGGISNEILKQADQLVRIPMKGKITSLNVSVSAAVILFEIIRQQSI